MQNITPFLWFNGQAEEAANFYVATCKDARVKNIKRYGEAGPGLKGSVMAAIVSLRRSLRKASETA